MAAEPRPENELITRQTVVMDEAYFFKKSFVECRMIYRGGPLPYVEHCDFINIIVEFDGAAQNTTKFIAFLSNMSQDFKVELRKSLGLD